MDAGSAELTRSTTAYVVALAFALTFLLTSVLGGGLDTALLRGVIAGIVARITAPWFVRPVMASIFDAMARDRQNAANETDAGAGE